MHDSGQQTNVDLDNQQEQYQVLAEQIRRVRDKGSKENFEVGRPHQVEDFSY